MSEIDWHAIAADLTKEAATKQTGLTVVMRVKAKAFITLGYDKGRVITANELWLAVMQNFMQHLELAQTDDLTSVRKIEIRDE